MALVDGSACGTPSRSAIGLPVFRAVRLGRDRSAERSETGRRWTGKARPRASSTAAVQTGKAAAKHQPAIGLRAAVNKGRLQCTVHIFVLRSRPHRRGDFLGGAGGSRPQGRG